MELSSALSNTSSQRPLFSKPLVHLLDDGHGVVCVRDGQIEEVGDGAKAGMYRDLRVGMHPEDVWIVVAISVAIFERDLGLSDAAEPSDCDTAASAGLGPLFGVMEQAP